MNIEYLDFYDKEREICNKIILLLVFSYYIWIISFN